jgi:hypothetical protein
MEEFFYWMGVIYSGIFLLVGLCIFVGLITDYAWGKMKNAHKLLKIMKVYQAYLREKP